MPKSTRECIREMSIRGSSQREIARTLGVSRNTVAKYLAEDLSPKAPVTRTPASPTMAPYADEVRGWLEADGRAPVFRQPLVSQNSIRSIHTSA